MYLGIDLGTSAVKALLVGPEQEVLAEASAPLRVDRPQMSWAEQNPADWWTATSDAVARLRAIAPSVFGGIRAIGLSGQMHGATLLDAEHNVLRPAILWCDGRSARECEELERDGELRQITGNAVMAGFTAPKIVWIARHEPAVFKRIAHVLLPKDWLRLKLTGDLATDVSDASGTLWLDIAQRRWSARALEATHMNEVFMPRVIEGTEASGTVRPEIADAWGLPRNVVVVGGGGDNAAGAAGVGAVLPGDAILSIGTSGVIFAVTDGFVPRPERGVHAFCHCVPGTWHQMSVLLSAASALSWASGVFGARDEASLMAEMEAGESSRSERDTPLFLPYLAGERTPHADPDARGVFFGLTHGTTRAALVRAVLEGVAFAFADARDAITESGTVLGPMTVIGGGGRSAAWLRILSNVLGVELATREHSDLGPAFGAARLARIAITGESVDEVCTRPKIVSRFLPDAARTAAYGPRLARFRDLYMTLRPAFAANARAKGENP
jgi:xylulokinase